MVASMNAKKLGAALRGRGVDCWALLLGRLLHRRKSQHSNCPLTRWCSQSTDADSVARQIPVCSSKVNKNIQRTDVSVTSMFLLDKETFIFADYFLFGAEGSGAFRPIGTDGRAVLWPGRARSALPRCAIVRLVLSGFRGCSAPELWRRE